MSPAGFNRSAVRKGLFSTLAIHFLSITGRGRAQTVQDSMSRQERAKRDLKSAALLRQSEGRESNCQGRYRASE